MAKFNLLLLDTCVILELFRLGIWDVFLKQCPCVPGILEKLDAGEAELPAVLCKSLDAYKICSSDAIVFRVLGALRQRAILIA